MSNINMSALKKSSAKDLLNKLQKNIEDSSAKKGKEKDTRFWYPEIDSAGNGSAIIRFLPAGTEDGTPFVKTYKHAFEENGMWMIADCPTTIGRECPVCDANRVLWKTGLESDKELGRKRGRNLKYVANVLIIKDPANPENEGQVKLFRYGKKIMDKIEECFKVDADLGEEPKDPFAFFDGMNFAFRITTVSKFLNYDKSKFVPAGDLYDGDEEKLTALLGKLHDTNEFIKEELYKPFDELKARFIKVTTGVDTAAADKETAVKESKAPQESYSKPEEKAAPKEAAASDAAPAEEDDDLAFFRGLVDA